MKANIGRLFGLVAFSLLGIGGVSAAEKALDSYEGARIMWLDTPYPFADTSPNYVGDAEAYMVGMEFTLPRASGEIARVIVLASSGGDASVYFNSRNAQGVGGFIGGIAHQNIASDAVSMVRIASANVRLMQSTTEFPLTSVGHVRFIVGTRKGRYTIEVGEPEAKKKGSSWYGLYVAGQKIIFDFRLMDKNRKK